jgi:hypothetical protein
MGYTGIRSKCSIHPAPSGMTIFGINRVSFPSRLIEDTPEEYSKNADEELPNADTLARTISSKSRMFFPIIEEVKTY